MSTGRGKDIREGAIFDADTSAKINPEKDISEERKDEWLKRRNKEDRKHKADQKVVEEWYELIGGKKLIKKLRKKNGGVYSLYICNVKKPRNHHVLAKFVKDKDGRYHVKKEVMK